VVFNNKTTPIVIRSSAENIRINLGFWFSLSFININLKNIY
jgi:hypothetical protein